jgi:hypothetical protein
MSEYKVTITRKDGIPLLPDSDPFEIHMMTENEDEAKIVAYTRFKNKFGINPNETQCEIIKIK